MVGQLEAHVKVQHRPWLDQCCRRVRLHPCTVPVFYRSRAVVEEAEAPSESLPPLLLLLLVVVVLEM